MNAVRRVGRLAFLVLLCLTAAREAYAKTSARIIDGSCRNDGQAYLLSFRVEGAFTPEMEKAIQSGIPTTFTYFFNVYRDLPGFFNEKVFDFQVKRTVHFDNIHKTYTILMGEKGTTVTVKSLQEAKDKLTVFRDLPVAVTTALPHKEPYFVNVKAQMEKLQIPFPFGLDQFFFFSSLWDFETPWARLEVKPAAPAEPSLPDKKTETGDKP